ncbi:MAG: hypothetical protein QGF84_06185, partial [Candidatus Thioglobus sp.]|nr:hypothetical protein [Candidatus Thioglobus sp.]
MLSFISRFMPKTVVGRMTSVLFVGIFLAQILGAWLWVGQLQNSEKERMVEISQAMGARIAQTVKFFGELPKEYRHIVLDQLRDMGGTRFFVSVNKQYIDLIPIQESQFSSLVRKNLKDSMAAQIGQIDNMKIIFVDFDNLKILTGDNLMVSLSPEWKRFTLLEPGDRSPFVVIQFPVDDDEWM